MGTAIVYASREDVKRAASSLSTAYDDARLDRALAAATRTVEGDLHRIFYPLHATRYFRWPPSSPSRSWRLWLGQSEVISVDTITVNNGATTISANDYFLEPSDLGPPYDNIEIDLSSSASFSSSTSSQRAIAVTGTFSGDPGVDDAAGLLGAGVNASATAWATSDGSQLGAGSWLLCGTEYVIVTAVAMTTTATTLGGTGLASSAAAVTLTVTDGTLYHVGEILLIGAERLLVLGTTATTVIVKRAFDGTVLAAHSNGDTIYALRSLTVQRGSFGSTAASHSTSDSLTVHRPPSLVQEYAIALAQAQVGAGLSGYATSTRGGESANTGRGGSVELADLAARAKSAHGRLRVGAV